MASLTIVSGPDAGRKHELAGREWILGRRSECQIVIRGGAVSRRHARIWQDGQRYFVEDLESRYGTFLNGRRLDERQVLRSGDRIRICNGEFLFASESPAIPPPEVLTDSDQPQVLFEDALDENGSSFTSKLDMASGQLQLSANPAARLRAMMEIMQRLGQTLALDEVLPKVLQSCFRLFPQADRGLIVLRTDDGRLIPRWTTTRRQDGETTIRLSRTIINNVIDSKEAILSADAIHDPQFAMSDSIADFKIRSVMCAPLIGAAGQAFGAVQIDTLDHRGRFQSDDLELLVSVATPAAMAIENAQFYERALQQQALQRDLELAHEVQLGFLPERHPDVPGYQFFHYYEPMVYVGGDYFDYIPLRDGRLAIVVADVAGHGIPAALMMAKLSAEARYCLLWEPTPGQAISELNRRLQTLGPHQFTTLILAVLDPTNHTLSIVSAGHMAPIIRRRNGTIEEPGQAEGGLLLGVEDGIEYAEVTIPLAPGDLFVLYTDGINEAYDAQGQQYTIPRLRALIASQAPPSAAVGQAIIDDVRTHLGKHAQDDDICFVCVSRG